MKPIIVLPPETMSPEDIKLLSENGLCVVVSKNPAALKFLDPLPAMSSKTQVEHAAIQLSRRILRGDLFPANRGDFAKLYVDCLVKGTPLDSGPTNEEREQSYFNEAKMNEISRIAREEARAERAAAKAKKTEEKP